MEIAQRDLREWAVSRRFRLKEVGRIAAEAAEWIQDVDLPRRRPRFQEAEVVECMWVDESNGHMAKPFSIWLLVSAVPQVNLRRSGASEGLTQ